MEDEFEVCTNCNKEISRRNFEIHTAFCKRKIQICCLCNEPVQRDDMKEHLKDSHAVIKCEQCNISMEKWELDKHKIDCPKRLVLCKYCEIEFPSDELDEHVEHCGSRTEFCSFCKQYIMLKDMEEHPEICLQGHAPPAGGVRSFNNEKRSRCIGQDMFTEQNFSYSFDQCAFLMECPICHSFIPLTKMKSHVRTCASSKHKCSLCGELVPEDEMKVHVLTKCPVLYQHNSGMKHNVPQSFVSNKDTVPNRKEKNLNSINKSSTVFEKEKVGYSMHSSYSEDAIGACATDTKRISNGSSKYLGECHICHKFIPWIDMNMHVPTCAYANNKCSRCGDQVSRDNLKDHVLKYCPALQKGKSDSGQVYNKNNSNSTYSTDELAAQKRTSQYTFSQNHFPEDEILDQFMFCKGNSYKCQLCLEQVPEVERLKHERICKMLQDDEKSSSPKLPSYADKCKEENPPKCDSVISDQKHELELYFMICPACQSRIPETRFESHMQQCENNMALCRFCHKGIPKRLIKDHLKGCAMGSKSGIKNYHKETSQKLPSYADKCKEENSPKCDSVISDQKHELELYFMTCPTCQSKIPETRFESHMQHCENNMTLCRFCQKETPQHLIKDHLKKCVKFSESRIYYDDKESNLRNSSGKFQAINTTQKNRSTSEKVIPKLEQCPYCHCHCDKLCNHLDDCRGLAICTFCNSRVFPKSFNHHINVTCKKYSRESEWKTGKKKRKGANKSGDFCSKPPTESGGIMNFFRTLLPVPKRETTTDDHQKVVMLPCEFCDKMFSMEKLIEHQSGCRPDLVHFPPSLQENSKKEAEKDSNGKIPLKQGAPTTNSTLSICANNTSVDSINCKPIGSERTQRRLKRNEETNFSPGEFLEYNYWKNEEIHESDEDKSNSHQIRNFDEVLDEKPDKLRMLTEKIQIDTEKVSKPKIEENIQMNLNTKSIRSIWNSVDDIDEDLVSNSEIFPSELSKPIDTVAKNIIFRNVNSDIENAIASNDIHEMSSNSENTAGVAIIKNLLNKGNESEFALECNSNKNLEQADECKEIFTPLSNLFKTPLCEICSRSETCMCICEGGNINLMPRGYISKGARPKQTLLQNIGDSISEHEIVTQEQKLPNEFSNDKEISAEFLNYQSNAIKNSGMSVEIHQNAWNTWREKKPSESE